MSEFREHLTKPPTDSLTPRGTETERVVSVGIDHEVFRAALMGTGATTAPIVASPIHLFSAQRDRAKGTTAEAAPSQCFADGGLEGDAGTQLHLARGIDEVVVGVAGKRLRVKDSERAV